MSEQRVPLAWSSRWRRIRSQAIPVAAFVAALAGSAWLWQERGAVVQAIGEVDSPRVDVTSPAGGLVVDLPNQKTGRWSVYDHVQEGEVIAQISDSQGGMGVVYEVRAPISGTLVAVNCWPGQSVIPGSVIATIAADHGRHIVGYLPEESPLAVKPGMSVTLEPLAGGGPRIGSEVERVGRQIERMPRHQWAAGGVPRWGTPVRIKMPGEAALRPGALVNIAFESTTRE